MSLIGLLNQTITIYAKSSYGADGREIVGAGVSVQSRFQATTKRKLLPNGSLLTIDAIVYVLSTITVNTDDKVSYNGSDYKVYGKYAAIDGAGQTNHFKLELIKWKA